jgi:hypothetical protein
MKKQTIVRIGISAAILLMVFLIWQFMALRSVEYEDSISGISFYYPKPLGIPEETAGNNTCPEEDTYRTPETLSIFDRELKWKDIDLKSTESFVRMGIRFYEMNPEVSNNCNDDVLRVLAKKEMTGEEFSSFRLTTVNIPGFYGVHNENGSRLDTEFRDQYTLFKKESNGQKITVIQPYFSFIPYHDSPEWQEIEQNYKGDILLFIKEGETADEEREILKDFQFFAESLKL